MYNLMFDFDLMTSTFNPVVCNSPHAVMSEPGLANWTQVRVYNWSDLCYVYDHRYNSVSLNVEVKKWLQQYCSRSWRHWFGRFHDDERCICFLFRDRQIAMLFKLTWC